MKKNILLLTLLCACNISNFAQNKQTMYGEAILKEASELRSQKDYKGALDLYNLAHDGDPYYWDILIERASAYYLDSNYTQSIKEADYLIQQTGQIKRTGLMIKGAAYSTSKDYKNAYATFDEMLQLNEHDFNAYYEKGIVAAGEKNYEKAIEYFQKSLLFNPYYFRSHYNLGVVYSKLGRLTESLLALQTALIFTNIPEYAGTAFGALEDVAQMSETVTKAYNEKKSNGDNPFEQVDEIIASKIVNNKDYKSGLIIDEIATRQMQVAISSAQLNLNNSNFAMHFYLPLLKQLSEKDMNAFQLFLFSDFNLESIKKYTNKKSNRNAFQSMKILIDKYCDDIVGTRVLNFDQRTKLPKKYLYIPDDEILIVGKATFDYVKKDVIFEDDQFSIFQNGILISEGNYKNKKKQGTWKYYNKFTGNLIKIEQYNDGVLSNFEQYYSNGVLGNHEVYDKNESIISAKKYSYAGTLTSDEKYESSKNYSAKYYSLFGTIVRDLEIKNDKIVNGVDTIFYNSGKPLRVMNFDNGEIEGWLHEYYESGKLKEKRFYKKGVVNGLETTYWENGNVQSEIEYQNNQKHGPVKYFNEQGVLIKTDNYQNGKANGVETQYNPLTGKKLYEKTFKNNDLYGYKFFNNDDSIIFEMKDNGKPVAIYKEFDQYGNNLSFFEADDKGIPKNVAYVFYPSGVVKSIDSIKDGDIHGTTIRNYENGIVSEQISYIDGMKSGLYNKFYENGRIYYSGNYTNDTLYGVWEYYNHDGSKFRKAFFNADKLNGTEYYYFPNGKLKEKNIYFHGNLAGIVKYDTAGKLIDSVYYKKLNGPIHLKYANGNPLLKTSLKNGRYDGQRQLYYPNNQLYIESNFRFGELNGKEVYYYPNGKIKYLANYENGSRNGIVYQFNASGDTTEIYPYKNDDVHGTSTTFINNDKRYEIQYKNGDIHGTYTLYSNGKVAIVFYYDEGLMIGYTYQNDKNELVQMIPLKQGTGKIEAYFPNGQKSFTANRIKNRYDGAATLFYDNGKVAETRNFLNGNYEGVSTYYNINGILVKQISFKDDELHGEKIINDNSGKLIQKEVYNMGTLEGESTYGDKKYTYYYNQLMK